MASMGYPVTGAHLALIESGQRIPSVRMAEGLARVLGEDEEELKSLAKLGGRADFSDLSDLTAAAAIVRHKAPLHADLLRDPGVSKEWLRPHEVKFVPRAAGIRRHAISSDLAFAALSASDEGPRLRSEGGSGVPVHATTEAGIQGRPALGFLTLPVRLSSLMRLGSDAFAFPVTEDNAHRVRSRGIGPGLLAISNGRSLPLEMGEIYLVRQDGRALLSHVWWDRSTLVLLPDHADDDIERLAVDEQGLEGVVLGQVSLLDLRLLPDIARGLEDAGLR